MIIKQFEKRLRVRPIKASDYQAIAELQMKCFPGMKPWMREQFESQLKIFPEGQICVTYNRKLVASSSSLIVRSDIYTSWHNWKEIADSGYIRNHDYKGDTLYGIEIMVDPEVRGYKLARRMYDERKKLCKKFNLKRIMIGGRIPGYFKHAKKMSAEEYVSHVMKKNIIDPVLTVQAANGFEVKNIIPDYFPSDTESLGYATHCEWLNPEFHEDPEMMAKIQSHVRICLVQYRMRPVKNFGEFARQAEFFMDVASDYKADFAVYPELFTTQLLSIIEAKRPGIAARKLAEYTERFLDLFSKLSIQYNVNIIAGSQFVAENNNIYNVSFLFRRNGAIDKQYKLHVTPGEKKWWGIQPGNKLEIFDTDCGKIAILIGYDIQFPELARIAVAGGANIIFVPFNTEERHGYLSIRYCGIARAIENQVYVAATGCTGNLPLVPNADIHYSQAAIFTPSDFSFARDAVASESSANNETVVINDIDISLLIKNRMAGTMRPWFDRRKELYSVNYKGKEISEI